MLAWFRQLGTLLSFNFGHARRRAGSSLLIVLGTAGVVLVLVSVLSMGAGFRRALNLSASTGNVILLQKGSDHELVSSIDPAEVAVVEQMPGVARDEEGPLVSPEMVVMVDLARKDTGRAANVVIRGVEQNAMKLRSRFGMVEGVPLQPGQSLLLVGDYAASQFTGLDNLTEMRIGEVDWTIVGRFTTQGAAYDTELWADASFLQSAYRRPRSYQSIRLKLADRNQWEEFKKAVETDPRLNLRALSERGYYGSQAEVVSGIVTGIGFVIGLAMALGATFGALNLMYGAVMARGREIATLRVLGFPGSQLVLAVLLESLALSLLGGILGAALSWLLFDGFTAATLNFKTFNQMAFAFAVTPSLVVVGLVLALSMGILGGIFPAIHAARVPITRLLRD